MRPIAFLRNLFQRNQPYMPVFAQQATFLKHAADTLCRMTETVDSKEWKRCEKEIKACETQGDSILTEFYEVLGEKLIATIRRSDMQMIAMHIDEFLDKINDSAKSFRLYQPSRIDQQIKDLAQYVSAQANAVKQMMSFMGDLRKNYDMIATFCDRITEIEHAADDVYEEYIAFIFKNEENAIEVIKYKNIAEILEACTDSAKRISDSVRRIVLRYID